MKTRKTQRRVQARIDARTKGWLEQKALASKRKPGSEVGYTAPGSRNPDRRR